MDLPTGTDCDPVGLEVARAVRPLWGCSEGAALQPTAKAINEIDHNRARLRDTSMRKPPAKIEDNGFDSGKRLR
jgi:hypothetical protein